jgi:hypothetical protein
MFDRFALQLCRLGCKAQQPAPQLATRANCRGVSIGLRKLSPYVLLYTCLQKMPLTHHNTFRKASRSAFSSLLKPSAKRWS